MHLEAKGAGSVRSDKMSQQHPHVVGERGDEEKLAMTNTTRKSEQSIADSCSIRKASTHRGVAYFTTIKGADGTEQAPVLDTSRQGAGKARPLREWRARKEGNG